MRLIVLGDHAWASKFRATHERGHQIDEFSEELARVACGIKYDFVLCGGDQFDKIKGHFTCPIFVVCKMDSEENWLYFFDQGADAILFDSFSPLAMMAHIYVFLRRCESKMVSSRLGVEIDLENLNASVLGRSLDLTITEFKVFKELVKTNIASRDVIQRRGLGRKHSMRTLDVHVCSLRKKLKPHGISIEAIRGVGYQLVKHAA